MNWEQVVSRRALGAGSIAVAALALLLTGCGSDTPAYANLQNQIRKTIDGKSGRHVKTVDCTPHRKNVSFHDGYVHFNCHVGFTDGTSYTTAATIEQRDYNVEAYNYQFDDPGQLDITTASLPKPTVPVSAASPTSLFTAKNLQPVVAALTQRFHSGQLILSMALYPGELVAVVADNQSAQLVTAHQSGALTVGPATSYDGQRSGISMDQLDPAVPQQLAHSIATLGHIPLSQLDRFELAFHGDNAYWDVYPHTGPTKFQAGVDGDALESITGTRAKPLR